MFSDAPQAAQFDEVLFDDVTQAPAVEAAARNSSLSVLATKIRASGKTARICQAAVMPSTSFTSMPISIQSGRYAV